MSIFTNIHENPSQRPQQEKPVQNIGQLPTHLYNHTHTSPSHRLQQHIQINKQYKHKLTKLQNKSIFFQGQLNPLYHQNQGLKEQLTGANRMMIAATQMLRGLLPEPSSLDKKLELQMANLEGVSALIRQDWLHMQQTLRQYTQIMQTKNAKIQALQQQYQQTLTSHKNYLQKLQKQYEQIVTNLNSKLKSTEQSLAIAIKQAKQGAEALHSRYRRELEEKEQQKRKKDGVIAQEKQSNRLLNLTIGRLRQQITHNAQHFQQSKLLIIENYTKILTQKQAQLRQQYQYIIKMRQQQHQNTIKQLNSFIQSLQNKITAKEELILQLYENVDKYIGEKDRLQKEYGIVRADVRKCREQIDRYIREMEDMQATIQQQTTTIKEYKQSSSATQQELVALQTQHAQTLKQLKQAIENHRSTLQQKDNQLLQLKSIKQRLQRENNVSTIRINQLLNDISGMHSELAQWKVFKMENLVLVAKIDELNGQIGKLQIQVEEKLAIIKGKQEEIQRLDLQHKSKLKQQQQKAAKTLSKQLKTHKKQLQALTTQHEQALASLQQQHNTRLQQMQQQLLLKQQDLQKYVQNLEQEWRRKVSDIEEVVKSKERELGVLLGRIEEAASERAAIQEQHARILLKHKLETQEMLLQQRLEHNKNIEQMHRTIQFHRQQFQKELKQHLQLLKAQQKQKQQHYKYLLFEKDAYYNNMLRQKQQQKKKQINLLEENIKILKSSNVIIQLENKYNLMLERMKLESFKELEAVRLSKERELGDLRMKYEGIIQENEQKYKSRVSQLEQEHLTSQRALQQTFATQLQSLSQKLSQNLQSLTSLNEQLLHQKQAHNYSKMSRQQKIQYLCTRIEELNRKYKEKETRVIELEIAVEERDKMLGELDRVVEEKMKKKKEEYEILYTTAKEQFERKWLKQAQQNNQKLKKAQIQRIQLIESLYKQFQQLQHKHSRELQIHNRRYNQLEQLFQERPSRQEDVHRIKELSLIKEKMEIEVEEFRKKVNSANQIVRYLNLQLENYKNVYDIFGPEGHAYHFGSVTNHPEQALSSNEQQSYKGNINYLRKLTSPLNPTHKQSFLPQFKKQQKGTLLQLLKYKNRKYKTEAIEQLQEKEQKQERDEQADRDADRGGQLYGKFVRQSSLQHIQQKEERDEEGRGNEDEEDGDYLTLRNSNQGHNNKRKISLNKEKIEDTQYKQTVREYRLRRKTDKSNSVLEKYSQRRQRSVTQTSNYSSNNQGNGVGTNRIYNTIDNQAGNKNENQKLQQLRNNAQMFISLIKSNKPPAQVRKNNQVYGRLSLKKRKNSKLDRNLYNSSQGSQQNNGYININSNPHPTNPNTSIDTNVNSYINMNISHIPVPQRQAKQEGQAATANNNSSNNQKNKEKKYQIKDKIIIVE